MLQLRRIIAPQLQQARSSRRSQLRTALPGECQVFVPARHQLQQLDRAIELA